MEESLQVEARKTKMILMEQRLCQEESWCWWEEKVGKTGQAESVGCMGETSCGKLAVGECSRAWWSSPVEVEVGPTN